MSQAKESVLYFNGDGDCITIPDNIALQVTNYTVEVWLKTDGIPKDWVGIFGKINFNYNLWLCYLGQIGHNWHTTQSAKATCNTEHNLVQWDQWQHIAITNDGTTARTYINSEFITESSVEHPLVADETRLIIGASLTGDKSQYFKGYITEVRLWNKARCADEIKRDMYHRLQGDEEGLVGYWPLSSTTVKDQVALDKSPNKNDGKIYGAVLKDQQLPGQLSENQKTEFFGQELGNSGLVFIVGGSNSVSSDICVNIYNAKDLEIDKILKALLKYFPE